MSPEPHYHEQPATFDPDRTIPEDAPLAQGHDEDRAADVRDAAQELKDGIEEQPDEATLARKPGDHAADEVITNPATEAGVPDGSVDDVLSWVGADKTRAQQALDVENDRATPRTTLISRLHDVLTR